MRPKTGDHDIEVKVSRAREFLEDKDKVIVTVTFRGCELAHIDEGRLVLDQIVQKLEDVGKIEALALAFRQTDGLHACPQVGQRSSGHRVVSMAIAGRRCPSTPPFTSFLLACSKKNTEQYQSGMLDLVVAGIYTSPFRTHPHGNLCHEEVSPACRRALCFHFRPIAACAVRSVCCGRPQGRRQQS